MSDIAIKVQDLGGFVLAGAVEPVGAGLPVEYAGATARYSQFGTYTCSEEDAASCVSNIVNAIEATLMGSVGKTAGTLVWDRISATPENAFAYATNDTIGATYYRSLDMLFEDYTNGAEIVIMRDCPPELFTNAVTIAKPVTISSKEGATFKVTASALVGFSVTNGAELVFTNVVFTRSGSSKQNFVTLNDGTFVLDEGAVIGPDSFLLPNATAASGTHPPKSRLR